jgi:hypothetical protein
MEEPMKEMTDEEADALDEYYTQNPPKVDPGKNGGFAKKSFRMVALGRLSEDYLLTRAMATQKTPTELISEMVRERIAAAGNCHRFPF